MKLSMEAWGQPAHMRGIDAVHYGTVGKKPIEQPWIWAKMLKKYGYEGVCVYWPFFQWWKHEGTYKENCKRLVEELDTLQMKVATLPCHSTNIHPRPWSREGGIKTFCSAIDTAKEIGAGSVVSLPGARFVYNLDDETAWKYAVDVWKRVAKKAEEVGQDISIEPLTHNVISNAIQVNEFLDDVGSDRLYVCWDTAHQTLSTGPLMPPAEGIKMLGKRINACHLKDFVGNKYNYAWSWWGMGQVNFDAQFKALKEIGFSGFGSIEHEGWFPGARTRDVGGFVLDFERVAKDSAIFMRKHGF